MKKRYFLLMIGAFAALASGAHQLTPDEALEAVFAQKGNRIAPKSAQRPELVYTACEKDINTVYVFNRLDSAGFLVVSADDSAMPLLGYSESGSFTPENIPPSMQWLIQEYGKQIAAASKAGSVLPMLDVSGAETQQREEIPPLVHALWGQTGPYNYQCPTLQYGSTSGTAVTGCVATAMAQVMSVHKWPVNGVGSNSYQFAFNGTVYSQSMNFADITFDWDNIVSVYDGHQTQAERDAVALLMHACGVACNMSYGLASTGGSGANAFRAAQGMVQYFDYDKGMEYCMREFYTEEGWNSLIYAELAAGRPVMLGGRSIDGGHEFVCDGYSEGDYFHINWGWGGASNGYFLLSALNPETQGVGGSSGGYTMSLDAIIGIQPPKSRVSSMTAEMCLSSNFQASSSSYGKTSYITLGSADHSGAIYNYSVGTIVTTLGVKLVKDDGSVTYIPSATYHNLTISPGQGYFTYTIRGADLPEGNYKVYPAFECNNQWNDILVPVNGVDYLNAAVTSSNIVFTPSDATSLSVDDISLDTPIYIGQLAKVTAEITATGDYYGSLRPTLVSGGAVYGLGEMQGVSFVPGQPKRIEWDTTFANNGSHKLEAGVYDLYISDDRGKTIGFIPSVTVNAAQEITPAVEELGVEFSNVDGGNGTAISPYIIRSDSSMSVSIEGTQGYWTDNVGIGFFNPATGQMMTESGQQFVSVDAGHTTTVVYDTLPSLTEGTIYAVAPWGDTTGQIPGAFTYVKLDSTTGNGIAGIDAPTDVQAYTLSGILAASGEDAVSQLPAGTYIVKSVYGHSVEVTKLIKK